MFDMNPIKLVVCGVVAGGLLLATNGVRKNMTPGFDELSSEQNAHLRASDMLYDAVARLKNYKSINPGAYVDVLKYASEIAEISARGSKSVRLVRSIDTTQRSMKRKLKKIHKSILVFANTNQDIVVEYEEIANDIVMATDSIIDDMYRSM